MTNLANALTLLQNYVDPETTPLAAALSLLETTPDPEAEPATQPVPSAEQPNGCYQTWSGTHYPDLASIPWQSAGSAILVECDGTGPEHGG